MVRLRHSVKLRFYADADAPGKNVRAYCACTFEITDFSAKDVICERPLK